MNINYLAPINKLGYGVVGTNIYSELIKNNNVSLFPIGPIDCDEKISEKIKKIIMRALNSKHSRKNQKKSYK